MPGCHAATVRQESLSAPAPAVATVQQQGSLFDACPCRTYRRGSSRLIYNFLANVVQENDPLCFGNHLAVRKYC